MSPISCLSLRSSELNACSWNFILKCFTKTCAAVCIFQYTGQFWCIFQYTGQFWCIWKPVSACIPSFLVLAFASISCEHAHLLWLLIVALLLRYWDNTNCAKHQIYRERVRLSSYALCTFLASHPREVLPATNVRVSATWLVPSVGICSRTFHQLLLLLLLWLVCPV